MLCTCFGWCSHAAVIPCYRTYTYYHAPAVVVSLSGVTSTLASADKSLMTSNMISDNGVEIESQLHTINNSDAHIGTKTATNTERRGRDTGTPETQRSRNNTTTTTTHVYMDGCGCGRGRGYGCGYGCGSGGGFKGNANTSMAQRTRHMYTSLPRQVQVHVVPK